MTEYILPILIFLGFGALSGILLLVASKVLAVKGDETASKVLEVLPGANCGGCGYSGCEGYANAIAKGEAPINMCKPGGADTMKAIEAILGQIPPPDLISPLWPSWRRRLPHRWSPWPGSRSDPPRTRPGTGYAWTCR